MKLDKVYVIKHPDGKYVENHYGTANAYLKLTDDPRRAAYYLGLKKAVAQARWLQLDFAGTFQIVLFDDSIAYEVVQ